jgi:hypothetical protein
MTRSRIWQTAIVAIAFGCAGRPQHSRGAAAAHHPHTAWQTQPHSATRRTRRGRNTGSGDSLAFRGLIVSVLETSVDSTTAKPTDIVRLRLALGASNDVRTAREGSAFNWNGFHVAVVAIYGPAN